MNNSQRKIILVTSIIVALLLFIARFPGPSRDFAQESQLLSAFREALALVSLGIGIAVWVGRDKTETPPDS